MNLNDVGNIALQAGLSPQGAYAAMAIAKTEGGLNGGVGDNGQSFGPFQFYTGGQLKNFAQAMGVSMAEAGQIARTEPEVAARWALQPGGYLGDTLRTGERSGLSGADLATFGQRYGQVSVSPERAGQNYSQLFAGGTPQLSGMTTDVTSDSSWKPGVASDFPRLNMSTLQPVAAQNSANGYVFPVKNFSGQVQDHWGSVKGGSDLMAPRGTPVVAMESGTVDLSGWDKVGGNALEIKGDDGNEYYYAHFDSPSALKVGQRVGSGTYIAPVGNTGDASGGPTHLHLGIGPDIKLGADKYGGTGGDYDAVGLLQRTLDGQGSSQTDWKPGVASDMPKLDMSQLQGGQSQWSPGIATDMPKLAVSSPSTSTQQSAWSPGIASDMPKLDQATLQSAAAWPQPTITDTSNDYGMDQLPAGLMAAPTNDYGMDVVPIGLQSNPNLTPL